MKAEQTECIRVYLRYRSAEDREVQRRMKVDVMRGRAKSQICRDALRAYYAPPTPPTPAPEVATLTRRIGQLTAEVDHLAQLVAGLTAQVGALHNALAGLDVVRAQNAQLQTLLLAATFGDRGMKRAATEAAAGLVPSGNGNGTHNG